MDDLYRNSCQLITSDKILKLLLLTVIIIQDKLSQIGQNILNMKYTQCNTNLVENGSNSVLTGNANSFGHFGFKKGPFLFLTFAYFRLKT